MGALRTDVLIVAGMWVAGAGAAYYYERQEKATVAKSIGAALTIGTFAATAGTVLFLNDLQPVHLPWKFGKWQSSVTNFVALILALLLAGGVSYGWDAIMKLCSIEMEPSPAAPDAAPTADEAPSA